MIVIIVITFAFGRIESADFVEASRDTDSVGRGELNGS